MVGCTIDPNAIGELCNAVKNNPDEELSSYSIRGYNNLNNSQKKNNYINSFIDLFNKSSLADGKDSTSVITSILHFNDSPKVEFSFDVAILAKNSDGDYCRLIHNKNYGIYDQWTWCQVPSSKDVRDKAIAIKRE